MTDTTRCEPPPEWRHVEWHFVDFGSLKSVWQWSSDYGVWRSDLVDYTPVDFAELGYTYLAPCRPDDATERLRLEGEVTRLREALDIAREGLLIVSGQRQCIDNLLSNEAVALEALRLIEGPENA